MIINNSNLIWKSLADPTRRTILDLLKREPQTTGFLCGYFSNLSRFAVMKHLGILHDADLIIIKREGKYRWNFINPAPIQEIYERWMSQYAAPLASAVLSLKNHIENKAQGENTMSIETKQVEVRITIHASQERVWQAIVEETGEWWRKDFYVYPDAKLVFEAYPGGRLYEDAGEGKGGLWATVMNISPPELLQMVAHLAPQYGGPATSILELRLAKADDGTTLSITDSLFGHLKEGTEAQVEEGWRMLYEQGLKPYVENHS